MARPKKRRTLKQLKQPPGELDFESMGLSETLIQHPQRARFQVSHKRFDIIPGGRRSGKSLEARFRLIWGDRWLGGSHHGCLDAPPGVNDPTFVYAAPTFAQAKRVMWDALKREIPHWAIVDIIESELTILFQSGAKLIVRRSAVADLGPRVDWSVRQQPDDLTVTTISGACATGTGSARCASFASGWFARTQANRRIRRGFREPTRRERRVPDDLRSRGAGC